MYLHSYRASGVANRFFRDVSNLSRRQLMAVLAAALTVSTPAVWAQGGRYFSDDAWRFGITADSQWTITHELTWEDDDPYYAHVNPDYREENPNYVSVSTALKLNEAFIEHGVRFVVQLGDLTDRAGNAAMNTHARARQPLYDAGIGFFPVRGNHETYGNLYGLDPDFDVNVPAWREAFPQTQGLGPNIFEARNFNRPYNRLLRGLSYSFDYGPAGSDSRFVFVDSEATAYRWDEPVPHPVYGMGSNYLNWVVYQHDEALTGAEDEVIEPGAWFRIDSAGNPSTNFYAALERFPIEENASPRRPELTTSGTGFRPGDQQSWIDERLQDSERPAHAFILSHRNLMGQNHVDTVWGNDPGSDPQAQNIFYRSLQENQVGYFLSAHDHMHTRSIVTSPDGRSSIEQLIASSSDPKFYSPAAGTMDEQKHRETPISQELSNIGFYIVTVDGSRVSVEYYSDETGNFGTDYCWPDGYPGEEGTCRNPQTSDPAERMGSLYAPEFDFVKKENWGYGLNGRRFVVPQGVSYAGQTLTSEDGDTQFPRIADTFQGTQAQILYGENESVSTDNVPETPRALAKTVTTGWTENPDSQTLRSHILSLWGMDELGTEETDTYVLAMSYTDARRRAVREGEVGIATFVDGRWVNAVDENFGGTRSFVLGPWVEGRHGLGTFGVDPETATAWAVLNYNADFAVASELRQVASTRPRLVRQSASTLAIRLPLKVPSQ